MENNIEKIISEESFWDENGNEFIKVILKGLISGKYRGTKLLNFENEKSLLFDFEIYEAEVICKSKDDFRKNKPYIIDGNEFPKEKLPPTLQVTVAIDKKSFGIDIVEPMMYLVLLMPSLQVTFLTMRRKLLKKLSGQSLNL